MVVLSYDTAKKSILFLAIYMIVLSLLFKGVALVTDISIAAVMGSLESLIKMDGISLPDISFNFDTLSFDGIKTVVLDSIKGFVDNIIPVSVGFINVMTGVALTSSVYDKPYLLMKVL